MNEINKLKINSIVELHLKSQLTDDDPALHETKLTSDMLRDGPRVSFFAVSEYYFDRDEFVVVDEDFIDIDFIPKEIFAFVITNEESAGYRLKLRDRIKFSLENRIDEGKFYLIRQAVIETLRNFTEKHLEYYNRTDIVDMISRYLLNTSCDQTENSISVDGYNPLEIQNPIGIEGKKELDFLFHRGVIQTKIARSFDVGADLWDFLSDFQNAEVPYVDADERLGVVFVQRKSKNSTFDGHETQRGVVGVAESTDAERAALLAAAASRSFSITLGKTYYRTGYINPGPAASQHLGAHDEPVTVILGMSGARVLSRIDRKANANGSVRVIGKNAAIAEWFQQNFKEGDRVTGVIQDKNTIQLLDR